MSRPTNATGFFSELRRRHVVRVGIAYAVAAWLLIQLAAIVLPTFDAPHWVLRVVIGLFILFFPVALILAWAFEITPSGVRRTPSQAHPLAPRKDADMGGLLRTLAVGKSRRSQLARAGKPDRTPQGGDPSAVPRAFAPRTRASTAVPSQAPISRDAPAVSGSKVRGGNPEREASLANLRHDLRSPINAIVGYAEMLLEEGAAESDPGTAGDLRKIREAGKELQQVVDDVFAVDNFKRQRGSSQPGRETFAKDVEHRLRTPLNAVIGYTEMLLEREQAAEHGESNSDIEKIGRAGRQLLDRMDEIVKFCVAEAKGEAADSDFERISGIARDALTEMRGIEPDAAGAAGITGGALLVVDDNELNRELLAKRLALHGFTVSSACSGEEGLERMRSQSFDLVLLDVVMPGLNGMEVLQKMKEDPELCDIPVIMISALDEADAAVRCIEIGAADYVTKPFEPVLLRARVAAALRTRRLAVTSRQNLDELGVQEKLMERVFEGRFPESVAQRVRAGETEIADRCEDASILCVRFLGLAMQASSGDALDGLQQLRAVRTWLRKLAAEYDVETLIFHDLEGLIVTGVPTARPDHAQAATDLALRVLEETAAMRDETGVPLRLRMGLHTGSVIAGVAGEEALSYELWGEAVQIARGLALSGTPDAIHASTAVQARLGERYAFESRGVVDLGDHGQLRSYFLRTGGGPSK